MKWQVFYTPHTDDESIGMAGAIVRAREAGDNVLVVLVTDNQPSAYMARVFGRDDLMAQRRIEWSQAMSALDVNELQAWEIPEGPMSAKPFDIQWTIERRMTAMHAERHVVHHHTVWGLFDIHPEAGIGSLSHGLCANALMRVAMRPHAVRASLYGVYVYAMPEAERFASHIVRLTDSEMQQKRRALSFYKANEDSIGYGYRSVPELIDSAMSDPHEYVMELR